MRSSPLNQGDPSAPVPRGSGTAITSDSAGSGRPAAPREGPASPVAGLKSSIDLNIRQESRKIELLKINGDDEEVK